MNIKLKQTIENFKEGDKVVLKKRYEDKFFAIDDYDFSAGITPAMVELYKKKGYVVVDEVGFTDFTNKAPSLSLVFYWDKRWFKKLEEVKKEEEKADVKIQVKKDIIKKEIKKEDKLDTILKEVKDLKSKIEAPMVLKNYSIDENKTVKVVIDDKIGTARLNDTDTFDKSFGIIIATARATGLSEKKVQGIIDILYDDIDLKQIPAQTLLEELNSRFSEMGKCI